MTAGGHLYQLPSPFFVLATQNPVEQEGTYPLPEAQLDRFMFLIHVGYPSAAEEGRIARETTVGAPATIDKTIDGEQLTHFQEMVRRVPVPDHIYDFVVDLVRRSRPGTGIVAGVDPRSGDLGSGTPSGAISDPRGEGASGAARELSRANRGYRGAGRTGVGASYPDQFSRGIGRRHQPRHHQAASR